MDSYVANRALAILVALSILGLGYTLMSVSGGAAVDYDLTIDNIPVNFSAEKTMYLDTQTNDRAFIIYNDYLKIRSQYLTFYDLNTSYEHDDVNQVIGAYCYTTIPAQNATLDSITPVDMFELSSWNGTVTVSAVSTDLDHPTLEVNSTTNASLFIRVHGLHRNYEYKIFIDGHPELDSWVRVNDAQYIEYNYTGPWSLHTITFQKYGQAVEVDASSLLIIQIMLCLGVTLGVFKTMVLPLKDQKPIRSEILIKTFIKAGVYIVVGVTIIVLTFNLFVGV
jgi:hypothetical protein